VEQKHEHAVVGGDCAQEPRRGKCACGR
jgi:hypothetical protein